MVDVASHDVSLLHSPKDTSEGGYARVRAMFEDGVTVISETAEVAAFLLGCKAGDQIRVSGRASPYVIWAESAEMVEMSKPMQTPATAREKGRQQGRLAEQKRLEAILSFPWHHCNCPKCNRTAEDLAFSA